MCVSVKYCRAFQISPAAQSEVDWVFLFCTCFCTLLIPAATAAAAMAALQCVSVRVALYRSVS
jgi:hypothetical protein